MRHNKIKRVSPALEGFYREFTKDVKRMPFTRWTEEMVVEMKNSGVDKQLKRLMKRRYGL